MRYRHFYPSPRLFTTGIHRQTQRKLHWCRGRSQRFYPITMQIMSTGPFHPTGDTGSITTLALADATAVMVAGCCLPSDKGKDRFACDMRQMMGRMMSLQERGKARLGPQKNTLTYVEGKRSSMISAFLARYEDMRQCLGVGRVDYESTQQRSAEVKMPSGVMDRRLASEASSNVPPSVVDTCGCLSLFFSFPLQVPMLLLDDDEIHFVT